MEQILFAYKAEDTQILAEKFDISGEFLEEIYEMFDFVEDKSVLHLFPIEEMDKKKVVARRAEKISKLADWRMR